MPRRDVNLSMVVGILSLVRSTHGLHNDRREVVACFGDHDLRRARHGTDTGRRNYNESATVSSRAIATAAKLRDACGASRPPTKLSARARQHRRQRQSKLQSFQPIERKGATSNPETGLRGRWGPTGGQSARPSVQPVHRPSTQAPLTKVPESYCE